MAGTPRATMTVQVIPELPDDFETMVHKSIGLAAGDALIMQGAGMVRGWLEGEELEKFDRITGELYELLHPQEGEQ